MCKLVIKELFTSLQGEGANFGKRFTFVRLAGCNLNCSFCDTDFHGGRCYDLEELQRAIEKEDTDALLWTGGEPTLQLTSEIVAHFNELGYYQAIETNGTRRPPKGLDYISCSPKVEPAQLHETMLGVEVGELRYPVASGVVVPDIDSLPIATHYFLSPIFEGGGVSGKDHFVPENLELCLEHIRKDPRWRLSVQMHKFLQIP